MPARLSSGIYSTMLSYLYQLIVGGAVFAIGLALVWRGGELGLRGRPLLRTAVLAGGLLLLALVQGLFQVLAGP